MAKRDESDKSKEGMGGDNQLSSVYNYIRSSSVWITSPEFSGWLMKRGFHWRKLWKKRWVALHGVEIVYMEAEPTIENTSRMTITKVQITSATVLDKEDLDGNEFGFAIHVNDGKTPTWYLRAESLREKKSWLMRLAHVHAIVRWLEEYEKVRTLGVGATGIVYELLHKSNGNRYAMKEMEIKNKTQMTMALAEAEMLKDIMENVSHPNIIHIEKVFQVGSKFYLVFPLCTGGELYEQVIRRGHFTEDDASKIIKDLVSGLHALHERDILHLDIKPENILFESMDENSIIKITDFGLSRVFGSNTAGSSANEKDASQYRIPTKAEMELKLKQFSEAGQLNRDLLRGTVGYMSPELILTGTVAKATDIFAAGVVLYILLCGHPPFQSKSNREVLERTCRSEYSISGGSWDAISSEAKDLVVKMLTFDPSTRISSAEILQHPWITKVFEDDIGNLLNGQQHKLTKRVTGVHNLADTLRKLSAHVNERKIEKLATTFTKLISSIGAAGGGDSILIPIVTTSTGEQLETLSNSDTLLFMDPDVRDALANAINRHGIEGKLSMIQFMCVLRYLMGNNTNGGNISSGTPSTPSSSTSSSSSSSSGGNSSDFGLSAMLLCKFIDRDGDGYISSEDLFTTQALILQKSDIFVRAIFRLYSESIWYPGRQINLMNARRQALNGGTSAGNVPGGSKILDENLRINVVESPKFITCKHIVAIFEKLGYNPASGIKVFNLLCDHLNKKKKLDDTSISNERHSFYGMKSSAGGGGTGLDGVNSSLASALGIDTDSSHRASDVSAALGGTDHHDDDSRGGRYSSRSTSDSISPFENSTSSTTSSSSSAAAASTLSSNKMDVADFIKAVELDDVLIQVILRKTRIGLVEIIRKAESMKAMASTNVSNFDAVTPSTSPTKSTISPERRQSNQVFSSFLEQELCEALKMGNEQSKSTFMIANMVGRAANNLMSVFSAVDSNQPS